LKAKKMGLYRQMIGRVLRPADGKPDAIILDHSGAVYRHGFAEDPVEWTLDPDTHAESAVHIERCSNDVKSRLLECSQCGAMRIAGEPCCACGFLPTPPPRPFTVGDGDLGLVEGRRAIPNVYDPAERARWHAMLKAIELERGYKTGWARRNYLEKFKTWPTMWGDPPPIPPTPEVRSWVRSRLIAYAKAKAKERT
jgi:hypothetical protein